MLKLNSEKRSTEAGNGSALFMVSGPIIPCGMVGPHLSALTTGNVYLRMNPADTDWRVFWLGDHGISAAPSVIGAKRINEELRTSDRRT